jgi:hypothetical protein
VNAITVDSEKFVYLRQNFPKISEPKMRKGIFIGGQVKQQFTDPTTLVQNLILQKDSLKGI